MDASSRNTLSTATITRERLNFCRSLRYTVWMAVVLLDEPNSLT